MTKRAGRKKHRNGAGPLKPAPGPEGPIASDPVASAAVVSVGLSVEEQLKLELMALRNNWLLQDPNADKIRQTLLNKILRLTVDPSIAGSDAEDGAKRIVGNPSMMLEIFRTISIVEQRQQRLDLTRLAILARVAGVKRPPEGVVNVNTQVVVQPAAESPPAKKPWELARELLSDALIRDALMGEQKS